MLYNHLIRRSGDSASLKGIDDQCDTDCLDHIAISLTVIEVLFEGVWRLGQKTWFPKPPRQKLLVSQMKQLTLLDPFASYLGTPGPQLRGAHGGAAGVVYHLVGWTEDIMFFLFPSIGTSSRSKD